MLLREYNAMRKGYEQKQYRHFDELRYSTFLSISPLIKAMSYEKFIREYWPHKDDKLEQDAAIIEPVLIDPGTWDALKRQMVPRPAGQKTEYEKILAKHNLK